MAGWRLEELLLLGRGGNRYLNLKRSGVRAGLLVLRRV